MTIKTMRKVVYDIESNKISYIYINIISNIIPHIYPIYIR